MRAVFVAAAVLAATAAGALAQGPGGSPVERLMAADANRDGAITKAEARAAREAAFGRLDANGDGFIGADERVARGEKAGKRGGGGGGDSNGDGKVSRAEFMAAPYRGFDRFDANRNETLEATELAAARELFQQRKSGTP
jgi:EF hand